MMRRPFPVIPLQETGPLNLMLERRRPMEACSGRLRVRTMVVTEISEGASGSRTIAHPQRMAEAKG